MIIKKMLIILFLIALLITGCTISDEAEKGFNSIQVVSEEKTLTSDTFSNAVLENNIKLVNKII